MAAARSRKAEGGRAVLLLSYSYPPANAPAAQRPYFFARYLPEHGWRPVVVTAKAQDSSLGHGSWGEGDGAAVIRTGSLNLRRTAGRSPGGGAAPVRPSLLRRAAYRLFRELAVPDKGLTWVPPAFRAASKVLREDPGIEAVFSTSPLFSNHLAALLLKRRFGLRWIADFRDFHYIENYEVSPHRLRRPADRLLERLVLSGADDLVFISETMRRRHAERYPWCAAKTHVIYNGFDPAEFAPPAPVPAEGLVEIFYAGSFYGGERSPEPLLLALQRLLDQGDLSPDELSVAVAGPPDPSLAAATERLGVGRAVRALGVLDRRAVLERMARAHFLWLIIGDDLSHSVGFPVKGYEYLGARRPILAFVPPGSEAARIVGDTGSGVLLRSVTDAASVEANASVLRDALRRLRSGELAAPVSSPAASLQPFLRPAHAAQLAAILSAPGAVRP